MPREWREPMTTFESLFISFVYLMPFWSVMGVVIMMACDDAYVSITPRNGEDNDSL
jgi:hypothetical protein